MPGVLKPTPARRVLIKPWTLFKAVFVGTLGLVGQAYMIQGAAQPNVSSVYPYPGRGNVAAHGAFYRRHGGPQKIEPIYGNIGGHKTNLAVAYRHWPRAYRNWKIVPKGVNITGRLPTTKANDAGICALGAWFYNWTGLGGGFVGSQCGFTIARILGLLKFLDSSVFQASFVVLGAYILAQRRAEFLAAEDEKWRAEELAKMNARMGILRNRVAAKKVNESTANIRADIAKLGKAIQALRKGASARSRRRRQMSATLRRTEAQASRLADAIAKGEMVVVPNEGGGIRTIPVGARNSERQANSIYNAFNVSNSLTAYPLPRRSPLARASSAPVRRANRPSTSLKRASSAPVRGAANNRRNALKALASVVNNRGASQRR
jgi:hypothetical protein